MYDAYVRLFQMVDNYNKDTDLATIVDMFDWYILPSTNPDGYAYTWQGAEVLLHFKHLYFVFVLYFIIHVSQNGE